MRLRMGIILCFVLIVAASTLAQNTVQAPQTVIEAAIRAAQNALGVSERPSNWRWEQLNLNSDTSLGCDLVSGTPTNEAIRPWRITLTFAEVNYVVHVSPDASRVVLCDTKFSQGTTAPQPTPLPTTEADFTCPPDFAGYMPPRLSLGAATAAVEEGGLPNRLRTAPSINSDFAGEIQPGRTLDRVINGPACSDSYVWWLVEIDGVTGWTAESDSVRNEYFLTPLVDAEEAGIVFRSNGPVTQMHFSPDGQFIVALAANGQSFKIWNIAERQELASAIRAPQPVLDSTFTQTGSFVTADTSGALRFWLIETQMQTATYEEIFQGEQPAEFALNATSSILVTTGCAALSSDSQCIQGQIAYWDGSEGTPTLETLISAHPGYPGDVQFSPDESLIATSGEDGILMWNPLSGVFISGLPTDREKPINDFAFSPDGERLAWASCTRDASPLTDPPTCMIGELAVWNIDEAGRAFTVADQRGAMLAVAYNSDGSLLAAAGEDGIVRIYNASNGRLLTSFDGHEGAVNVLEFSPDAPVLASGGADGSIRLWDVDGLR